MKIIDINVNNQAKALFRKKSGGNEWRELGEKGGKQVLSKKEILELAELIKKIEDHYGVPQDIEWAQEGCPKSDRKGKFYITQSRPITTLKKKNKSEKTNNKCNKIIENLKKYPLTMQVQYPVTPIIYFESGHKCYSNNPFIKKYNIKQFPSFVAYQSNRYEGWNDDNISKIKDKLIIKKIIEDSSNIIKKYNQDVFQLEKIPFKNLNNNSITKNLRLIDKILTETYYNYIFYIDEYFETDDEKLLIKLPKIRIDLSNFVDRIQNICKSILKDLKKRFPDVDAQAFNFATFEELIYVLKNPNTQNKLNNIINRPISYISIKGKLTTLTGDNAQCIKKYLDNIRPDETGLKNIKKFEGYIAFTGKERGIARIISEANYNKVEEKIPKNEKFILVAPMTRPEIVPYLKNCLAIITDEGGITCHAAIVARELKIPCIIGTKIATQILHDGDLVEVDANEGIVKII